MKLTAVINCIVGSLGLIVSIIAIIISINTTRRQTKIDLFNKRYNFYIACDTICACCITKSPELIYKRFDLLNLNFNDYTFGGSKFLFNKETSKVIISIYRKSTFYADIKYSMNEMEKHNRTNDDLYKRSIDEEEKLIIFFSQAREELENRISKYLNIT